MTESLQYQKQIDELLNLPQQMWLLGAGISKDAGIPLMYPLTDRVEAILKGDDKLVFEAIRKELPEVAHVEHVMSHIGDMIAIAERTKSQSIEIGGEERKATDLHKLHGNIQRAIRDTMRWGYIPPCDGNKECLGEKDTPIVKVKEHLPGHRRHCG